MSYQVVARHTKKRCHHADDVERRDGIPQHNERHEHHKDPLGGVSHRVAEGRDQVQHAEGKDVLGEVEQAAEEEQSQGVGPADIMELRGNQRDSHDWN